MNPRQEFEDRLAAALAEQWPSYAAYAVSFAVIGIMWVNHHGLFHLLETVDRRALFANGLLLLDRRPAVVELEWW